MPKTFTFAMLKPFLWLAVAAFLTGFTSYLVVGGSSSAVAREPVRYVPVASAPASDEWNLPKHI